MLFWPSKTGKKTAHIGLLDSVQLLITAAVVLDCLRAQLQGCPAAEVLPDLCEPEDRAVGHPDGPELQVARSLFHCLRSCHLPCPLGPLDSISPHPVAGANPCAK